MLNPWYPVCMHLGMGSLRKQLRLDEDIWVRHDLVTLVSLDIKRHQRAQKKSLYHVRTQ
jgi:hypothetical protein